MQPDSRAQTLLRRLYQGVLIRSRFADHVASLRRAESQQLERRVLLSASEIIEGPIFNPATGNAYYLLGQDTWTNSEAAANALGGHLATINDAAENQWVLDTFADGFTEFIIGLNDAASEGTFEWVSGETSSYRNWRSGAPDSANGDEDFAVITLAGTWNDYNGVNVSDGSFRNRGIVEVAAADSGVVINEFRPNPPGQDPDMMQVELAGPAGVAFSGRLLSIEAIRTADEGRVDGNADIAGTFDSNGLLVVDIPDFPNPSFTFVLTQPGPNIINTDIDVDDDGVVDVNTLLGSVYDALSIVDRTDGFVVYAAQLGGIDLAFSEDEPQLAFRDRITGDWYVVNDPVDVILPVNDPAVRDADGELLLASEFDVDPTLATFGQLNPSTVGFGFVPGSNLPVGSRPQSIASGDLDLDGDEDLIVGNSTGGQLSLLMNNGDGTFSPEIRVNSSLGLVSVATADFNNDGYPDVATAGLFSDDLSIHFNDGTGVLGPAIVLADPIDPTDVIADDFDGDGFIDIATTSRSSGNSSDLFLLLYLNDGTGSFDAPLIELAEGFTDSTSASLISIDLEGDGDRDIAFAQAGRDRIRLFQNDGAGTFTLSSTLFLDAEGPISLVSGDLDNDGDDDLLSSNVVSDDVSIWRNIGSGTFESELRVVVGDAPRSLRLGDLNLDGSLDVVVPNQLIDDVSVLLGNGDGTFQPQQRFAAGDGPYDVEIADFDDNGTPDFAIANEQSDDVTILFNTLLPTNNEDTISPTVADLAFVDDRRIRVTLEDNVGIDLASLDNFSIELRGSGGDGDPFDGLNPRLTVFIEDRDATGFTIRTSAPFGDDTYGILLDDGDTDPNRVIRDTAGNILDGDGDGTPGGAFMGLLVRDAQPATVLLDLPAGQDSGVSDSDNITNAASPEVEVTVNEAGRIDIDFQRDGTVAATLFATTPGTLTLPATFDLSADGEYQFDATFTPADGGQAVSDLLTITVDRTPPEVVSTTLSDLRIGDSSLTVTLTESLAVLPSNFELLLFAPDLSVVSTGFTQLNPLNLRLDFPPLTEPGVYVVGFSTGTAEDAAGNVLPGYSEAATVPIGPGQLFQPAGEILSAGLGPQQSAAGDLDGDGDLDLVVAFEASDNVGVYFNDGFGSFSAFGFFPAGDSVENVTLADFDGDGDLDVAATAVLDDAVSILFNAGNGLLGPLTSYAVGDAPESIVAADFDGDGDIDVATANEFTDDVTVLLNQGDGTFAPAVSYAAGDGAFDLAAGDVDGDGDFDLITANLSAGTIALLLNDGSGAFGTIGQTVQAGLLPFGVTLADLDGDGDLDAAAANFGSDDVSVFLWDDTAGQFAPQMRFDVGDEPFSISAADFDGDGNVDLVVPNRLDDDVLVLLNDGSGTFANEGRYSVGSMPYGATPVDFDGDDDPDLAVANNASNEITLLRNVSPSQIDLLAGGVTVVSGDLVPGGLVTVAFDLTNQGTRTTTTTRQDAVYLSLDGTLSSDDTLLGRADGFGLAAGGTVTQQFDVALPADAFAGGGFLIAVADDTELVIESDESNNIGTASPVTIAAPDLVVSNIAFRSLPNGQLQVSWTETNEGDATAGGSWQTRVRVDDGAAFTVAENAVSFAFNDLAPNESIDRTFYFSLNGSTVSEAASAITAFDVTVTVDSSDAVAEANADDTAETNNIGEVTAVGILDAFDLRVVNASVEVGADGRVTVDWEDLNDGPGDVLFGWADRVVLFDVDGTVLSAVSVGTGNGPTLAAGASLARSTALMLPFGFDGDSISVRIGVESTTNRFEWSPAGDAETNNQTTIDVPIVDAFADLTVVVATPAGGASGRDIDVSFTVTNDGGRPASELWSDRVLLVEANGNNPIALGDLSRPVELAPGQSYTRTNRYTLPEGISGDFRIRVETNFQQQQFESDGSNNVADSDVFAVTLSPFADLQAAVTAASTNVTAGSLLSVEFNVTNVGTGETDAAGWFDDVYISTVQSLDGLPSGATRIARVPNASFLAPGESYEQRDVTWPIPADFGGTYFLYAVADATNRQFELGFEQNVSPPFQINIDPIQSPAFFTVTPDQLVVNPDVAVTGQAVFVRWEIENTGGEPITGDWSDAVGLSPIDPASPDFDDRLVRILQIVPINSVDRLDPGETYVQTAIVNIPTSLDPSFLDEAFLFIDPDHLVTASGTGGVGPGDVAKRLAGTPISISDVPSADLEVTLSSVPATAEVGQPLTVGWSVTNEGQAATAAGQWTDAVYLSSDETLVLSGPDADVLLGRRTRVGGLQPTESYQVDGTFTIPPQVAAGDYFVFVVADDTSLTGGPGLDISAPAGPVAVAPFSSGGDPTALLSDLAVTDLFAVPNATDSGTDVIVTWTVRNDGPTATSSGEWLDRIFFAPDTTAVPGDPGVVTLATVRRFGALADGASYTASAVVSLPQEISGDFAILIATDVASSVVAPPESGGNDTRAVPISVGLRDLPDIGVAIDAVPTTPQSGVAFDVTWTVTNSGLGDTLPREDDWVDAVFLTLDGTVTSSSIRLATVSRTGGLDAGQTYTASANVVIPLGIDGPRQIVVVADERRDVFLGSGRGDIVDAFAVDVAVADFADLAVSDVSAPAQAFAGQPVTITWTVSNEGAGATNVDTWFDNVYLSRDAFLDFSTAISLGSVRRTGGLGVDASYDGSLTRTLPTFAGGTFFVFVVTDRQGRVFQGPAAGSGNDVAVSADTIDVSFPPLVDLATSNVVAPAFGITGQPSDPAISWVVTNVSDRDAVGEWVDAVYLSSDDQFDAGDTLVARVTRTGGLDAGASYTASTDAALPAKIVPGDYFVLVRADSRGLIREDDLSNNQGVSADTVALDVEALTLGEVTSGALQPGGEQFYRVDLPAGETLRIDVGFERAFESQFYVQFGRPPTPADFDFAFDTLGDLNQSLTVAGTSAGTYYVLLDAIDDDATQLNSFDIVARALAFGVESVDVTRGSNLGRVTLTLSGAQFTEATQVSLVSDQATVVAEQVLWRDDATLWATFDLTGQPGGDYGVRVEDQGRVDVLEEAFEVDPQAEAGTLRVTASVPGVLRANTQGQVTFFVENNGFSDIPAPLLDVEATGASLFLADGQVRRAFQVIGINRDGPAGILPPGFRSTLTYTFEPDPFDPNGDNSFSFSATAVGDPTRPIQWDDLRDDFRPDRITPDAWNAIWSELVGDIGDTLGNYERTLAETATYLSQLGRYVDDPGRLFDFRLAQADAALLPTPLEVVTDVSLQAKGLQLELQRSFYPTISARDRTGLFGLGWRTPWDTQLIEVDDRRVIDLTTTQISFRVLDNNTFEGPAGAGTLRAEGEFLVYRDRDGTEYGFNDEGQLSFLRDKNGNQIVASFANGLISRLDHSDGSSLVFSYNASGHVERIVASDGTTADYTYGPAGQRLTSATTAAWQTQYDYAASSNRLVDGAITRISRPGVADQVFRYDEQGRVTSTDDDGTGTRPTHIYGPQGEITLVQDGGQVRYLLTDSLKPGRVSDAAGNVARILFDDDGNAVRFVAPGSLETRFQYDADGRLVGLTDPLGNTTNLAYDASVDLLRLLTNSRGGQTILSLDDADNLASISLGSNAAADTVRFTYDANGLVETFHNARGDAVLNEYLPNGLLSRRELPGGVVYEFGYDTRGNLTSIVDPTGTTTYDYDNADRLTRVDYPGGRSLAFTYDAAGRRLSTEDESGRRTLYGYDTSGQLITVRLAEPGVADEDALLVTAYGYDGAGRLASQTNADGTTTEYTHDPSSRIESVTNRLADGTVASQFSYSYDASGRVLLVQGLDGTWTYGYDAAGQLVSADFVATQAGIDAGQQDLSLAYAHDAAGNRTLVTRNGIDTNYAADAFGRYATVGTSAVTYDADGNLTFDGVNTFAYDALGRLVTITGPNGTTTYSYNALGQRVAIDVDGQTTTLVVDPLTGEIVTEQGSAGATFNVFGLGLVGQDAEDAGGLAFFGFDALGSVTDVFAPGGNQSTSSRFDPFGNRLLGDAGDRFGFLAKQGAIEADGDVLLLGDEALTTQFGKRLAPTLGLATGDANVYRFDNNAWSAGEAGPTSSAAFVSSLLGGIAGRARPEAFAVAQPVFGNNLNVTTDASSSRGLITPAADVLSYVGRPRSIGADPLIVRGTTVGGGSDGGIARVFAPTALGTITLPLTVIAILTGRQDAPDRAVAPDLDGPRGSGLGIQTTAIDPNAITGPAGFGPDRVIAADARHSFRIDFENLPTATAPAQRVLIETVLGDAWDPRTVELTGFAFNDTVVELTERRNFYAGLLDLRPDGIPLLVSINASIDFDTRTLRWVLDSIDPNTGEAPTDPNLGLLPVNNDDRDGEGFVTYTIRANGDVVTGDSVSSEATIIFDDQPPLTTNDWPNAFDAVAPIAGLTVDDVLDGFVELSWQATDDVGGTGIGRYDVFVSENGEPFRPFLTNTLDIAARFPAQPGQQYRFFVVATDNVGNASTIPTSGFASASLDAAAFVDAFVFYNDSVFDGLDSDANADDDDAIAVDKRPLRPGQKASFENYTSYDQGLNGIMIDIEGLGALEPGVSDFRFRTGNDNAPDAWSAAPSPAEIRVRRSAGVDGSDRLTLVWGDNAVRGAWLEVTILATDRTGLLSPVTFYFGNAPGEAGNSTTDARVNALDVAGPRDNQHGPDDPAGVDDPFDFNRDGLVDASDIGIVLSNLTSPLDALRLIDLRISQSPPPGVQRPVPVPNEEIEREDAVNETLRGQRAQRFERPGSLFADRELFRVADDDEVGNSSVVATR
ncbi:MAG: FG-GAP-like repeat-containing protein [Planctomycetota bacterium]